MKQKEVLFYWFGLMIFSYYFAGKMGLIGFEKGIVWGCLNITGFIFIYKLKDAKDERIKNELSKSVSIK